MQGLRWVAGVRELPASLNLAISAAIAAVIATILKLLDAPLWSQLLAAFIVCGTGIAVAIEKLRTDSRAKKEALEQKRLHEEEEAAKWARAVQDCVVWPMPAIDDVDPYAHLGVVRSPEAHRYMAGEERIPPYIERDVDRVARERLQARGSVLLIGTPTSGVTRTAYHLASTVPSSPQVVVPVRPQGLTTALGELDVLSRGEPGGTLLLWLDRIDRYTHAALSADTLRRCRDRSSGLRIVATVPSTGYDVWEAENRALADFFGAPVVIERLPSGAEVDRAAALYPGLDFAEGIAPAFTVAGRLLARLHGGEQRCPHEETGDDCALARALVAIALEWVATDIGSPLPIPQLVALAEQRLGGRRTIDPGHLDHALTWAARPVVGAASLIDITDQQAVMAHPAIAEIRRAEGHGPSNPVWTAAIEATVIRQDSAALGRIGFRAHTSGNQAVADRAWAAVTSRDDPAADSIEQAAHFSMTRGDAADTIRPLTRLLELNEATYGPDHAKIGRTLSNLAIAWSALGQLDKAHDLLEQALAILERACGPDHPDVALVLGRLGNLLTELGQPAMARELLERALRIEEREYGPDHIKIAATLGGLGGVWRKLGQPGRACELQDRALRIVEREYGPGHPEVAGVLTDLGLSWSEAEQPNKARELQERALGIKERHYGRSHREVLPTLTNLGIVWTALGQPEKARELLQRALRIGEREYGPDHLRVATVLVDLGNAWALSGQTTKARDMLERALRIEEREYGPDHIEVAITSTNLGGTLRELGQLDRARELQERALRVMEREFGSDHMQVARALSNLGITWANLGRPEKARELLQRALRIAQAHFPDSHPRIKHITQALRTVSPDGYP